MFFPSALSFHALAVLERCTLLAPFCSYHRPLQGVSDSHCGLSPRPSIASDRRSRADESIGYRGALPAITPWLIAVNPRPRRPPVSASVISSCSSAGLGRARYGMVWWWWWWWSSFSIRACSPFVNGTGPARAHDVQAALRAASDPPGSTGRTDKAPWQRVPRNTRRYTQRRPPLRGLLGT